jgi:hypothetical protein
MNKPTASLSFLFALVLLLLGLTSLPALSDNAAVPKRASLVKAESITLPEFKLDAVTFLEAVRQLNSASKQHDPAHEGVNFLVTDATETNVYPKITLDLTNVSVAEVAEHLAASAGFSVSAQDFAFVLSPKKAKQ